MKYVYSASFLHESNTFSVNRSDMAWFKKRCWKIGEEVLVRFRGVKTEFGGFIDALETYEDIEMIPIIAAEATPSGPVTADVAERVHSIILTALEEAPQIDAVLLSLHGAMVKEDSEDGEGDLAEAIRKVVGKNVPIYATLDSHANITQKMVQYIDVMIPYDFFPHSDKYERGLQAAHMLGKALRDEHRPYMATRKLPILFPLIGTFEPVMKPINDFIQEYEAKDGVLNVSITHGFYNADIYEGGICVQVITDGQAELAEKIASDFAALVWEYREKIQIESAALQDIANLKNYNGAKPMIIADCPDNPGGGAHANGTLVLRKLIEYGFKSAVVALINDPESVDKCMAAGEGSFVQLELGGKILPERLGEPVHCMARVLKLTDGRYRNYGPMNPGLQMDLLGTALIDINGIRVIVVKNPTQPYDVALMELHGINPNEEKIIVLKSAVHFRGAYDSIMEGMLRLIYPGVVAQRPQDADIRRCKRPVYPLDLDTEFVIG